MKYILLGCTLFWCNILQAQEAPPFFDSLHIVSSTAGLNRIDARFAFTEGPVADRQGRVYFTDQPNNRIWRYNLDGGLTEFKRESGRANGLDIDRQGNIIACADENDELWSITPDGRVTVLLGKVDGKKLNGPNDLWIDKKGGIYFTDPYYQRDYWTRKQPDMKGQYVYYLPKGATQPVVVSDELVKPNGITGSADGKHLFVADIGDNKTYKFTINANGSLSNKKLFVPKGADGIVLDEKGNLYLTKGGITVYNPTGVKIAYIPVPEETSNICFGGAQKNILFITARTSVYFVPMNVKGQQAVQGK
ncbi:SMP-30/gluconolactonase/LRE family protein [Niabella soli]|uniref:Gluconolactonase n=1 Tax=Niabella soli DSM 19437 TaxID=929713 RepID=W0F089_9BACT|nr:SMP-30/gluconolactonase/LRE family protein [Niabella soli]AHF14864.1 gluconolactonase [Niabella soli DSM 19437]